MLVLKRGWVRKSLVTPNNLFWFNRQPNGVELLANNQNLIRKHMNYDEGYYNKQTILTCLLSLTFRCSLWRHRWVGRVMDDDISAMKLSIYSCMFLLHHPLEIGPRFYHCTYSGALGITSSVCRFEYVFIFRSTTYESMTLTVKNICIFREMCRICILGFFLWFVCKK